MGIKRIILLLLILIVTVVYIAGFFINGFSSSCISILHRKKDRGDDRMEKILKIIFTCVILTNHTYRYDDSCGKKSIFPEQ
jgi:hypothetical protein